MSDAARKFTGETEATILVVDDDIMLRKLLSHTLEEAGFRVLTANDGQEGLRTMFESHPDLLLLDVSMPNMDGWTMCQRVREVSNIPIIMLTGEKHVDKIVKGLELGADDYVVKPFQMQELLARVQANLRRAAAEPVLTKEHLVYNDGWLTVNMDEQRVLVDGEPVRLTPTEFNLLARLMNAAPRIMRYRDLLESVWGWEYIDDLDYLRVYVWRLRRKLEPNPKDPTYIVNVTGVGYRFERQT